MWKHHLLVHLGTADASVSPVRPQLLLLLCQVSNQGVCLALYYFFIYLIFYFGGSRINQCKRTLTEADKVSRDARAVDFLLRPPQGRSRWLMRCKQTAEWQQARRGRRDLTPLTVRLCRGQIFCECITVTFSFPGSWDELLSSRTVTRDYKKKVK